MANAVQPFLLCDPVAGVCCSSRSRPGVRLVWGVREQLFIDGWEDPSLCKALKQAGLNPKPATVEATTRST
eukprot:364204-Chlamydomonas_euryale.AAC.2